MAFGDFTVDRNSTKYVLGSGGTIGSYATDEPAFEFNADGSYKGLLVEPAATNICLQSEDLSTTWTAGGDTTVTANNTTAPDGNSTADKLGDDSGGGTGGVSVDQSITVVAETKYTASVFLKKSGLDWALLQARNTGGVDDDPFQYFDLDNGVTGTASAGIQDATIVEYPNDWYRCSITWTQGVGDAEFTFRVRVANSDGDVTLDLDGTSSIFVWGAQVETGPIATSYIPTTTASVTRVKDQITQTGASSLIGQTEGTLYVEVDWRGTSGVSQFLLSINDGTADNRMLIYHTAGTLRMFAESDDTILVNQGVSSTAYSGIQKFAFAYADSDFELYRNGSSVDNVSSGSLAALATLTDIDLGQKYDASEQANMHIRAAALFTRRLTDAEAIALTTL